MFAWGLASGLRTILSSDAILLLTVKHQVRFTAIYLAHLPKLSDAFSCLYIFGDYSLCPSGCKINGIHFQDHDDVNIMIGIMHTDD